MRGSFISRSHGVTFSLESGSGIALPAGTRAADTRAPAVATKGSPFSQSCRMRAAYRTSGTTDALRKNRAPPGSDGGRAKRWAVVFRRWSRTIQYGADPAPPEADSAPTEEDIPPAAAEATSYSV